MKLYVGIFVLLFMLTSCHDYRAENNLIDWQSIIIESKSQIIIIDRYEDYGIRDTCDLEEIKVDESLMYYKPANRGQQYFRINQEEKDSIFRCVYDIVANPVDTKQAATCYVGNISIGFSLGSRTSICKYNSVGDWTNISSSMNKLYYMLNKKTRISKY